jgi:hypothetical protein
MTCSKYSTFGEHLLTIERDQVTLSFSDIETILGFSLPKSARKFRTWWANDTTHSHALNGWLLVGWRVYKIDMDDQYVRFRRVAKLRLHESVPPKKTSVKTKISNIERARRFESKARKVMSEHFQTKLRPRQHHKTTKLFDLVSKDKSIVGETKYFGLTRQRVQPAKFSSIAETVWLLNNTTAETKFIVFGNSIEVPNRWLERFGNLVTDTIFYFLHEDDRLEQLN